MIDRIPLERTEGATALAKTNLNETKNINRAATILISCKGIKASAGQSNLDLVVILCCCCSCCICCYCCWCIAVAVVAVAVVVVVAVGVFKRQHRCSKSQAI